MTPAALRRDVEAARWYLALPQVRRRGDCGTCSRIDAKAAATVRGRKKTGRVPQQAKPTQFEKRYQKILDARVKEMHALLTAALGKVSTGLDERADDAESDRKKLLRVVDQVERLVAKKSLSEATVTKIGEQLQLFTSNAVVKQVSSVIAVDITASGAITESLLEAWVSTNLEIVQSLEAKYFEGARTAVVEAVTKGRSTDWLAEQLTERYGVAQSKAAFVARDQIGTLNAQVTQARQTSLGIEEYKWSTSGDERVRPEHRAREGRVFRWDTPPDDGAPGEPPLCRCSAIPKL